MTVARIVIEDFQTFNYPVRPNNNRIAVFNKISFNGFVKHDRGTLSSDLYKDTRPILLLLRILGVLPYHISSRGELVFRYLSIATIYSVALQTTCSLAALLRAKQILDAVQQQDKFDSSMVQYVAVGTYLSRVLLVPFAHWPETRKKLLFLNDWTAYQVEFANVTGKNITLGLKKSSVLSMVILTAYVAIQGSLFVLTEKQMSKAWWVAPVFLFCMFFIHFMSVPWVIYCLALKKTATSLAEELELHVVSCGFGRAEDVLRYRQLWLRLNRLTRTYGNSMGLTFGGQIIFLFIGLLFFTYYMLSRLSSGDNDFAVKAVLPFVLTAYIFGLCNAAHEATEEVGKKFLGRLQILEIKYPTKNCKTDVEIQRFYKTIARHPSVISFCGFANVNRGLLTSLMTALCMYMVVLSQFNMSTLETAPPRCNNTVSV